MGAKFLFDCISWPLFRPLSTNFSFVYSWPPLNASKISSKACHVEPLTLYIGSARGKSGQVSELRKLYFHCGFSLSVDQTSFKFSRS